MGEFDYDSQPEVSADSILAVAEEVSRSPKVSDEEREIQRLEIESQLFQSRKRDQERELEYRRRQAEIAAAKDAQDRQTAALEHQRNAVFQSELRKATERQGRDRTLTGLLDYAVQQRQFRDAAVRSARNAAARQDLSETLDSWMQMKFPPPLPAPVPVEIARDHPPGSCFGDRDFNVEAWNKRRRSWW